MDCIYYIRLDKLDQRLKNVVAPFASIAKALNQNLPINKHDNITDVCGTVMKELAYTRYDIGSLLNKLEFFTLLLTQNSLKNCSNNILPEFTDTKNMFDHVNVLKTKEGKKAEKLTKTLTTMIETHKKKLQNVISAQKKYLKMISRHKHEEDVERQLLLALIREIDARTVMGKTYETTMNVYKRMVRTSLKEAKDHLYSVMNRILSSDNQKPFVSILKSMDIDHLTENILYGASKCYMFPIPVPKETEPIFDYEEKVTESWTETPICFYSPSFKRDVEILPLKYKISRWYTLPYVCNGCTSHPPNCHKLQPGIIVTTNSTIQSYPGMPAHITSSPGTSVIFGFRKVEGISKKKKWGFLCT